MPRVRVAFSDETLELLDHIAAIEHGGDRDEAAADLLESWLEDR